MQMPKGKILVVDDEEALCAGLRTYLELEGYEVDTAMSAEEALSLNLQHYSLILLDIMMGKMSGTELAVLLKSTEATSLIPLIFLTAKNDVGDMVEGLNLGADDYISKPFSVKNVLARIEAVLRRTGMRNERQQQRSGVVCNRDNLKCYVDGRELMLPRKEFELLALLIENRGKIFTREELMRKVWSEQVVVVDRNVDVHITRIRSKIYPYGKNIVTRSGYGYGWQD